MMGTQDEGSYTGPDDDGGAFASLDLEPPKTKTQQREDESERQRRPSAVAAYSAGSPLEQAAQVEVMVAAQLARQFPRDVQQARYEILSACKRYRFAERAVYNVPVGGGKRARDLSIRFVEEALRCFRNVKVQTFAIHDDDDRRVVKACVWDVQQGVSHSQDVSIRKVVERRDAKGREVVYERLNSDGKTVFGVRATDDEMLAREGALVSKAIRNLGLRIIPEDIKAEAREACAATMHDGGGIDISAETKKVCDAFAGIGVSPAMLKEYLGHDASTLSPPELADLREVFTTLRDGEVSHFGVYIDNARMARAKDVSGGGKAGEAKVKVTGAIKAKSATTEAPDDTAAAAAPAAKAATAAKKPTAKTDNNDDSGDPEADAWK